MQLGEIQQNYETCFKTKNIKPYFILVFKNHK